MSDSPSEFLRTDFGHEVYDEWYLGPGSYNNCLMKAGFKDLHFYKKRRLEDFDSQDDNGFSLVAKK